MTGRPRILALFGARVIFGAERDNIEVLSALHEKGCDILCLVRPEVWNDHIRLALEERGLAWRKVPYIDGWLRGWRIKVMLRNPGALIAANWKFLCLVREFKPTHIHAFNAMHVLNFFPALSLTRIPMIYRSGETPVVHRWFWRRLWHFIVAKTRRFVSVSQFIANVLAASGVPRERLQVIYGVPPRRSGRELSQKFSIARGSARHIVFIGQIIEGKGPHLLIAAFRNLAASFPGARLLIAGRVADWDSWARRLRDETLRDPGLADRVEFLGFIEDVPRLLRHCDVLVAPSTLDEALGLVVMEAKAAGIPAIVFPSGGLPEMIRHGVDGFVCRDKSVQALTEALRCYLEDQGRVVREGAAAKESMRNFGDMEFGQNWLDVYEKTMT